MFAPLDSFTPSAAAFGVLRELNAAAAVGVFKEGIERPFSTGVRGKASADTAARVTATLRGVFLEVFLSEGIELPTVTVLSEVAAGLRVGIVGTVARTTGSDSCEGDETLELLLPMRALAPTSLITVPRKTIFAFLRGTVPVSGLSAFDSRGRFDCDKRLLVDDEDTDDEDTNVPPDCADDEDTDDKNTDAPPDKEPLLVFGEVCLPVDC